jgi:hypothetical protein
MYWEDLNDPFLPSKFSSRRENLDVEKLVFPYENYFWSTPGPKQYITRNMKINFSYSISSFGLGIDWVYRLRSGYSTTNTNSFGVITIDTKTNKYDNSYYKYDLQSISGPYVSYGLSFGNILSYSIRTTNISQEKVSTTSNKTENTNLVIIKTNEISRKSTKFLSDLFVISTNYITNVSKTSNEIFETNTISIVTTNFSVDTNLIFSTNTNVNTNVTFTQSSNTNTLQYKTNTSTLFSLSVSPNASFSFSPSSVYRIEDGFPLEDNFKHSENVGISLSSSAFDNFLSLGSSIGILNNVQWSRSPDPLKKKSDDLSTTASLGVGNSINVSKSLFDNSIFYLFPALGISHSLSLRLTKPKLDNPSDDPYINDITANSMSLSASFRVLKLSLLSNAVLNFLGFDNISLSTGINYNFVYLKSEYKYINDKYYWTNKISNPIGISISFGPWLSYSVRYRIDISNDNVTLLPASSSFGGNLSIKNINLKPVVNNVSYINLQYSLGFDYLNPINNSFSLSLSFGGMINEYWSFSAITSIVNTKIFRYVKEYAQKYNVEPVNLFTDIIDAINIFDVNALRRTLFKNQGVTISLSYDLYDWVSTISGGVRLYKDEIKNFAFFEPYIMFEVKSKKSIGIEFPAIQPELYRLFE